MLKKIFKIVGIGVLLFISVIVWIFFIQPKIDHRLNLKDLSTYKKFFKSIKHPKETTKLYYKAFFGNSSGTSNHCEHILVQIMKYNPSDEKLITDYYAKNYPELNISFIKSIDDCCGDDESGYTAICMGYFVQDQPTFSFENAKDFLPVYIIEYSVDGSHLLDQECN